MFSAKISVRRLHLWHRKSSKVRQPRLLMAPPAPDPRLPVHVLDPNSRFLG